MGGWLDFWGPVVFIVGYAISTVGFVPEYLLVIVVVTTVRLHELYDMARGMAVTRPSSQGRPCFAVVPLPDQS